MAPPHRQRKQYRKNAATATTKRCPECERTFPVEDFYRNRSSKDGRDSYCKPCRLGLLKSPRHAERAAQKQRERLSEPERHARHVYMTRDARLRRAFGLTILEYEAMLIAQSGRCAICTDPMLEARWLAVDHDHGTGRVRGLLCNSCNVALHKLETHGDWIQRAATYLEE